MANRSYIYLKNGDEARILTAGIYTIPYFWQLFWNEEDLRTPISLWKTAEKLEEEEEQAEKFYQEQNLDILLPIAKFQQNALQNRSFLEEYSAISVLLPFIKDSKNSVHYVQILQRKGLIWWFYE